MCCAAARCAQRVSAQDTRENALARFSLAVSSVAVRIVAGEEAWVLGPKWGHSPKSWGNGGNIPLFPGPGEWGGMGGMAILPLK